MIGRRAELAVFERVVLDGGRGLVLAGPHGVGRSTLARECTRLAHRRGRPALWTAATRSTRSQPFGAFARVLSPSPAGPPGLAEARAELLGRLGGRRGLLVVDDAHLLDDASAALVHQLAAEAATVVTVSTGERSPDAIVALWKDRMAERLDVPALTRDQVGEVLEAVAGHTDPATAYRLWHATGGNSMLLAELVRSGRADGRFADRHGVWRWEGPPPAAGGRLGELVADRLAALDARTRSALHVLALAEPIGLAMFERFFPPKAVAALEDQGLVRLRRSGRRVDLHVAPPVVGEVLRAGLSVTATRAIARRLLVELEAVGARRREDLPRLGALMLAGGDWGDTGRLLAAARAARDDLDAGLAVRLLAAIRAQGGAGHAVDLLEADVLACRGDDGTAAALRRALDRAAGATERARATALASAVSWSPAAPYEPAADGVPTAWTSLTRATARASAGARDAALADIDAALAAAGRAEHGELHLRLAAADLRCRILVHTGRLADAERLARDRHADAVTGPLPGLTASWAAVLGRILLRRGAVREALPRLSEAAAVLRDADFGGRRVATLHLLAEALSAAGRTGEARATLAEAAAVPPPAGRDAEAELAAARAAAACGDIPDALDRCRSVAAAARASGAHAHEMLALHELARLGEARAVLARLRRLAELVGDPLYADHAAALATADSAALESAGARFASIDALPLAAETCRHAAAGHAATGHSALAATARIRAREYLAWCPGWAAPAPDAVPAAPVLTAREREIALLAAGGSSDRDIAELLTVSVRTVQNHLHRAYAKLHTSGRRELAALLGPAAVGRG